MFFLGIFGQNLDFRSPETQAVIPTKRELMKPIPNLFRDENVTKYLPKWRFLTVPDTYRGFTECSRRFPILPEGLQWCPKVPSLLPRRCMHVKKKLITECRQKIAHRVSALNWWLVIDDWWLIIDHGWLMIDNWWLMTDDWWLMIDEWWVMIDDWW